MDPQVSRKPFVREVPRLRWFFRHPRYVRYLFRELTCIFIGAYTLLMVWGLMRLAQGPAAWYAFLDALGTPAGIVFLAVALGFSLYHTVTWFDLAPKALPVQAGEEFVPHAVIAGAHYAVWVLVSLLVLALAGVF